MTFGLIKSGRQLFYRDRLYGQSQPWVTDQVVHACRARRLRLNDGDRTSDASRTGRSSTARKCAPAEAQASHTSAGSRPIRSRNYTNYAAVLLRV